MYVGPIENEFGALIMENKEMANNLIGMFATAFITGDKGSIPEIVVNWDWKREKIRNMTFTGAEALLKLLDPWDDRSWILMDVIREP